MREQLATYLAALVSSGAVFHFGTEAPLALAMLAAAASALIGVSAFALLVKGWRWSAPLRSRWHRHRALVLAERGDGLRG